MIADELRALAENAYDLDGVLVDVAHGSFDDVCKHTIERVREALYAARALADRVEAVEREAARYRWLRDARYTAAPSGSLVDLWLFSRPTSSGAGIDSAIDDAIKEQADADR